MSENLGTGPPSPIFEVEDVPEQALRVYARLWQFETWLRRMVYFELRALKGEDWSQDVPAAAGPFEADKALTHMPTPEMSALRYLSLSQLTKLVRGQWRCFEGYLPPQALWDAKLAEISQIRHRSAHFRVGHVEGRPVLCTRREASDQ